MSLKSSSRSRSFTEGSLWDKILLFALPLACTGILQQLFNAADIAVVGQFTGTRATTAMAAVGACSPVISLILNLFIGLSLGSNVVIANAIGARDHARLSRAISTSLLISLGAGIITCAIGLSLAVEILKILSVPADVIESAALYLRIYMAGTPVILLYNFAAAIFRGTGDTRTPLITLIAAGLINVAFNLLFVIVFGMGVEGVAIATVISNGICAFVLVRLLARGFHGLKVDLRHLSFDKGCFRQIVAVGLPAGIQGAIFSVANIVIQSATNSLGAQVMAAGAVAVNIEATTFNVLNSFSQACVTFVSQNVGAKKYERCKKILKICLIEDFSTVFTVAMIMIFFGNLILPIFNNDPVVLDLAYQRVCILCLSHCMSLIYEVLSGYLRGFGISISSAVFTIVGVCVLRVVWVFFIFPLNPTYPMLLLIYPISLGTTALLLVGAVAWYRPAAKKIKERDLQTALELEAEAV